MTLETRVEEALRALSLEEKVSLLTGRDFWSTTPIERVGLRSMTLSDGPSGVRGPEWDERSPSLNLPSASALSASWDPEIAYRYGAVAAAEARRKGVDWVLGPTINIHRSPLGGRHFEAFSEDPVLTARLAAAYTRGLQDNGVAATPKHFVANDFETDRFEADVVVSERALREVYLLAFEEAIAEAQAWSVMSAYNSINGSTATENHLLTDPLVEEWGFDGVVVSDWTAVRSLESAREHQHLVMPGPEGPWGQALVDAVNDGTVDVAVIDEKARRLLRIAARVGALEPLVPADHVAEDGVAFARAAAAEGFVLLENRGELPWSSAPGSVAVIGSNADVARTQGGGSATVVPERVVSPLEGIRAALPGSDVTYAIGALNQVGLAGLALEEITNPATGEPGARVTFWGEDGSVLFVEDRRATELVWFGGAAPIASASRVTLETLYTPRNSGEIELGCAIFGQVRLLVDDEVLIDRFVDSEGDDLGAALLSPGIAAEVVKRRAGEPRHLRLEVDLGKRDGALGSALAFTVGVRPIPTSAEALIAEAVRVAERAEVAVVVVGTNAKVESEGFDRTSLALPGSQDALVSAVAAVNPRTVVVVNAGSPVLMPWRDQVAAVLLGWFGGQEFGHALTDVLTGVSEPGGRLPTTWPAAQEDVPVLDVTPHDGVVRYDEGIHVGYRAWLRGDAEPAYWLGHGRGYTEFETIDVAVSDTVAPGGAWQVTATVRNVGDRAGKHVLLVFAERPESAIDRPVRWLVGSAVVHLAAREATQVSVALSGRALAHWDHGWQYEEGDFTISVGPDAGHIDVVGRVRLLGS